MTDAKLNPEENLRDIRLFTYAMRVKELVEEAESNGVLITVERKSIEPLAMRNHVPFINVWEKR